MTKVAICVLVQMETDDPRLTYEQISDAIGTTDGTSRMRRAVLQHMPKDITRLIAVMPVEQMQQLMLLHDAIGENLTGEPQFVHPPPDYVPPTND